MSEWTLFDWIVRICWFFIACFGIVIFGGFWWAFCDYMGWMD